MKRITKSYPNLLAWRTAANLNQRDAARLLEISQSYYGRLERGAQAATGVRAKVLRGKTGVPIEVLVGAS
jgi:transcriptional regulator with XRE-family HTH domain